MARSYEERVADFEKNYGFTAGKVADLISKNYSNVDYSKSTEEIYRNGLRTLLEEYAENQIKPTTVAKDYSLDFNAISGIITDYERLIQAKYDKFVKENPNTENKPQPRQQFEGNLQNVINDVRELSGTWQSKKLVNSWAERIFNEEYDISDIRKITQKAYKNGTGYFVDANEFSNNKLLDEDADEIRSSGETVAMMRDAMQKVIQARSRGWYWNPLNWKRAIQESLYMRELNKQVKGSKGEIRPINNHYQVYGSYTLINGEDKSKLYALLKNTEKQMKQEAERAEFRRQKEEEKAKQEALEKEKANEINANKDANVIGEKVEFGDVFEEKNDIKSPVVQNEEKKEITKVME